MKGVKKCFGLLLLCSTICGLSLSVCFGDTNALKYPISSIDIGDSTFEFNKLTLSGSSYNTFFKKYHDLGISFDKTSGVPSGFRFPHTWRFSGTYNPSTNICELSQYSDGVERYDGGSTVTEFHNLSLTRFSDGTGLSGTFDYYSLASESPFDLSQSLSSGNNQWLTDSGRRNSLCSISNYSYTSHTETPPPIDSNLPRYNWSSLINIPFVNERQAYEESKPYYYAYNKLYLVGTDEIDGVYQKRYGLKMSQIFGTQIPYFSSLGFHFSLFDDPVNRLDWQGSPESFVSTFRLVGSIYFDSDYTFKDSNCNYSPTCISMGVYNYNLSPSLSSSDFNPSASWTLSDNSSLYYIDNSIPNTYSSIHCTVNQYHISNGDSDNHLEFSCPYTPSSVYLSNNIDFRLLSLGLTFGDTSSNNTPNLSTTGDYTFKDFYVITNNDDTLIDWDATATASGGNLGDAPGYGLGGGGKTEADWTESLKNLFGFSFVNPFSPLFNMFTNQDSCVSIPTLSSMLHAEETQVCPWFDSTTRSILTPVLSLASMMLVFGFAVRWLGSSSGNLFEDSRHEEVSNQGGRWGHFKKGGY